MYELLELVNKNEAGNSWIVVEADVFLNLAKEEQQAFCQALSRNTTLRRLDLKDNKITNDLLNTLIVALVQNTTLLDLRFNQEANNPQLLHILQEKILNNRHQALENVYEAPVPDKERTFLTDDSVFNTLYNIAYEQIEHGNADNLHALLSAIPQLTIKTTRMDENLLQFAVNHSQIKCAQMLISFGKHFHDFKSHINTALFDAIYNDDLVLTQLLLENGAYVNAKRNGFTPIHRVRSREMAQFLVAQGADVLHRVKCEESKTSGGNTVLHSVLWHKDVAEDLLEYLLEQGIDVNAQNAQDETALHLLIREGVQPELRARAIALLVKSGANPLIKDNQELAPLALAHTLNINFLSWNMTICRDLPTKPSRSNGFFDAPPEIMEPTALSAAPTETLDCNAGEPIVKKMS